LATRLLVCSLDRCDARTGRPRMSPCDDLLDGGALALEDHLDRAVGTVLDPADDAVSASLVARRAAEPNSLYRPADSQTHPDDVFLTHGSRVPDHAPTRPRRGGSSRVWAKRRSAAFRQDTSHPARRSPETKPPARIAPSKRRAGFGRGHSIF